MSKTRKKQRRRDERWDIANATTQPFKPFVDVPETGVEPDKRQTDRKIGKHD